MKKNFLLVVSVSALLLSSCGANGKPIGSNSWSASTTEGTLSSFHLLTPANDEVVEIIPTFTWEASENASYYLLEVATTPDFVQGDADEVYLKRSNIATNEFSLTSTLTQKNCDYYWKVTAYNKNANKASEEVGKFYYKASNAEEIEIEIEDAEDWSLHEQGSYADIRIDDSNFFGNGKKSLAVSFEEEDTNRGIPSSDGWMVITKTEERDLYGTDALYLDFYYSGNDANVQIRMVDNDGEYWYCPIQISNNAKQTIILKYSEFILRTKDTPIMNQKFDSDHIKYFEIVFEKAFGDGVALFSDIKAVNYANYQNMFVKKLDFHSFEESAWSYEAYHFLETVSEDGSELNLEYTTSPNENNEKGIGSFGYGFTRLTMNRYFAPGDAIKISMKYSGYYSSSANILFRILEQDNDRWQYKQPLSALTKDEYSTIVIPYEAMAKTDYIYGDGARQFYYILNLQLGINGVFGSGSISFKDIEIVKAEDYVDRDPRVVDSSGVIDSFDEYDYNAEMYYRWDVGHDNKDEAMSIDTAHKAKGVSNRACGKFEYKSDMGMATYSASLDNQVEEGSFNALRIWLKDASEKKDDPKLSYLDDVSATMTLQLSLSTGEYYRYVIDHVASTWTEYIIPFSEFYLDNPEAFKEEPEALSVEKIVNFGMGLQYFYYEESGKPYPVYTSSNPVYVDEIGFANGSRLEMNPLTKILEPSEDDPDVIEMDDMEYSSKEDLLSSWSYGNDLPCNDLDISNDVSKEGGTTSMSMGYQGASSPSYVMQTNFSSQCGGKGVVFDMKGDSLATVYFNVYCRIGSTLYQYRYTINKPAASWKRYTIGFDNIKATDPTNTNNLRSTLVPNIEKVTFGLVGGADAEASKVLVDNLKMRANVSYGIKTIEDIL